MLEWRGEEVGSVLSEFGVGFVPGGLGSRAVPEEVLRGVIWVSAVCTCGCF